MHLVLVSVVGLFTLAIYSTYAMFSATVETDLQMYQVLQEVKHVVAQMEDTTHIQHLHLEIQN